MPALLLHPDRVLDGDLSASSGIVRLLGVRCIAKPCLGDSAQES